MELTSGHLIQFIFVVATLAGSFQMIKSNLTRVMKDLESIKKELDNINTRIDKVESDSAVLHHQVKITGSILSPDNLEKHNREIQDLQSTISVNTRDISLLHKMHNGSHPHVGAS
mgnify:CR=1 FL=1|tara:strand:+ start:576 stop:920 length:345 start_codon:yes stop_codon:yes gene_type:complete